MRVLFKFYRAINFTIFTLRYFTVPDSWKALKRCDVLLLAHNNDRSLNVEGKSYSPLLHTIRFYLENNDISCSGISTLFDIKNCTYNYYEDKTINRVFLFNIIRSKIVSILAKRCYAEVKLNNEVLIWVKILKITKPKVVIAIQPYVSLCIASHKLLIPIYDLQHGVIGEGGTYGKDFNLNRDKTQLPTGYLCWNHESATVLNRWCALRNIQVEVLGNPWLYRFQKNEETDILVRNIQKDLQFNCGKTRILVTLQWGLDKFYPDNFDQSDLLHPALLDAIRNLDRNINWSIRLHPIQMKNPRIVQKINQLFKNNSNVDIHWSSIQPLPLVLSQAHGHITWDSHVVVEASLFGIKSYMLNSGHFSNTDINPSQSSSKNQIPELPYAKQELDGLITRSKGIPSAHDIIAWVNERGFCGTQNTARFSFDEQRLYEIVNR